VFLVNARDAKHVPGRKTDVNDAQWLQRLHSYGLLRASFRPKGDIAELRAYLRQRERLLDTAASHIQHMQKALTEMNLQLHHVVSDITGATGMRIIRAIIAGERNPAALAALRDTRCHSSADKIAQALTSTPRRKSCPICRALSQDFLRVKRTSKLLFLVQLYPPEMLMSVRSIWGQHFRRAVLATIGMSICLFWSRR
jgi:hypothetical protein